MAFNKQIQAGSILNPLSINESSEPEIHIEYLIIQGRILKYKKDYQNALARFYKAIQLIKDHSLKQLLPKTYAEVAFILRENNDLENCTKYYRYALLEAIITHDVGTTNRCMLCPLQGLKVTLPANNETLCYSS